MRWRLRPESCLQIRKSHILSHSWISTVKDSNLIVVSDQISKTVCILPSINAFATKYRSKPFHLH